MQISINLTILYIYICVIFMCLFHPGFFHGTLSLLYEFWGKPYLNDGSDLCKCEAARQKGTTLQQNIFIK